MKGCRPRLGPCLYFLVLSVAAFDVAQAASFQFGDVAVDLNSSLSTGADLRLEKPDSRLIGKLNLPGQQHLCDADNCMSLTGNAAPNQRLVDAPGGFSGANHDQGDLNYKQYHLTAAPTKLDSDLSVTWSQFLLRARGIGFVDAENINFNDQHPDTHYQPATTHRNGDITRQYAGGGQLLDAYVQFSYNLWQRPATITLGEQQLHWGESTFVALNSLNEINPPNANMLHMAGSEISEVFQPVPLLSLSFEPIEHFTTDVFYQFAWQPVKPDAYGSFFSTNDIAAGGKYALLGLGNYSEDPNRQFHPQGFLGLISASSRTATVLPESYGYAKSQGEYGIHLSYLADWLNDGTELGLYFMNYHSRFPYISAIASQQSCARNSTNAVTATLACRGFDGGLRTQTTASLLNFLGLPPLPALSNALDPILAVALANPVGLEPNPIDTAQLYLDYPENIHLFGLSFNTTAFGWSFAGEYSFRPNLPVQVQLTDVVFAALQPAFPRQDIVLGPYTLPGSRSAVPDYLSVYRHQDIQGGQRIAGYQRLQVGQFDLTGIRAIRTNPIGADQIILISEVGFTQIYNLPHLDQLQFEGGGGANDTHHSPGADGTGNNGVPDARRQNPTQQTSNFATSFSWGVRLAAQLQYNDVIFGWSFKPQLALFRDISGTAPFPVQNFIQGVTAAVIGTQIKMTQNFGSQLMYQVYTGGGTNNALRDRDNLALSFSYSF